MDYSIIPLKRSRSHKVNNKDRESANSSIIGVLLLITIVMVMGGIVSLVLFSQPLPDKVPIAYLSVSQSNERVELINKAGDTLTSRSIAIVVDGIDRTKEFRKPENTPDWGTLHAGEHIYYDSPQEPKSVQVLFVGNSGQYLLASSGPATGSPITIATSPTPVPTIPVAAIPTVIQVTPDSGYNSTKITTINVTGTAFLSGATVMLNGTGFADIPATDVTVFSPVQISCSFNLTGLPEGFRNVVVTNSDGHKGMLVGGFKVNHAEFRPIVDFVATPPQGTSPLTVQFNDTSLSSPVSWVWSFGDGGTSISQNASHTYIHPGNYSVNLTVNHTDGSDSENKTGYIIVKSPKPEANFTSNVTQIPVNGFVQFYDTSINTPTSWQWTFGDDLFYDKHQNPVHQYINPGIFTVHLTATNADGSDSVIKTKYIQVMKVNHAPVLAQITNKTTTVGIPLAFIITASDLDNDRLTYSAGGLPTGATFDPATRTFTWTPQDGMAGNYSVSFTVSDGSLTDSETRWIMVNSRPKIPPTAQFTPNTTLGQAPLTVKFTDQSVSAGTTTYQWDMNNDAVVDYSSKNPVHTYQTAGTYTVKLTVTNASGSDSEIKTDYIKVSSPVVVSSTTLYLTDFGIKADGSDETTKLQSTLNYASSHGYTAVSFPTGGKTIGISSSMDLPGNMEYIGNGCTLKLLDDSYIIEPTYYTFNYYTGNNVYIHHLIFDGNMNKQYRPHPPEGYYFPYRPNGGIVMYDGARFEYNEVKNYGGYMVEISHGDDAIISNNIIHDGWQYGITTAGSSSHYSDNARISNNTIYRMGQVGIKMQHTSNSVITNNKITLPARYDLFTSSWPHNTGSGTPDGSPEPSGIRLYSHDGPNDHVTITGNTITGNGNNNEIAIESDNAENTYITITQNQIRNANTGINLLFNNGIIRDNTITYVSTCIANRGSGNTVSGNTCSKQG